MPELTEATVDAVRIHERQKYANLLSALLCMGMIDTKQNKVSPKYPEENIASAKLQAE